MNTIRRLGSHTMMGSDYWHPHWGNHNSWQWEIGFALIPVRMNSGKFVWLKKYYHGSKIIQGPGSDVVMHQYMTVEEFTWHALNQP